MDENIFNELEMETLKSDISIDMYVMQQNLFIVKIQFNH